MRSTGYEFKPDGTFTNRGYASDPWSHLEVSLDQLEIAYRINGSNPQVIYRFEGALYAVGSPVEQSLVGPPVRAAYAFALQKIVVGRIALKAGGDWLVRVTEPFWRVIVSKETGTVDIEPRFSTICTMIDKNCFHLDHWDDAVAEATRQAEHHGLMPPERFSFEGAIVAMPGHQPAPTLGSLWPACPEQAKTMPVQRVNRPAPALTEADLRDHFGPASTKAEALQLGVLPGGVLANARNAPAR